MRGCCQCGLVFGSQRPPRKALAAYYADEGEWAESQQDRYSANPEAPQPVFDAVDAAAGLRQPRGCARALDIGCGTGNWLDRLALHGWETYGIEPATDAAFPRHRRLAVIPADGSFDFVILHHVLEHVGSPGAMLTNVSAALRQGGWVFISVPSLDTLAVHGDFHYCINGRAHLQAFTFESLRTLLEDRRFDQITQLSSPELERGARRQLSKLRVVARRSGKPTTLNPSRRPLDAAIRALEAAGRLRPLAAVHADTAR